MPTGIYIFFKYLVSSDNNYLIQIVAQNNFAQAGTWTIAVRVRGTYARSHDGRKLLYTKKSGDL